jgi:hypothetical protein
MENMQKPAVSPAAMQAPFPSVMSAQNMPLTMPMSNMPQQVSPAYGNVHIKQMPVAGAYDYEPCHHPVSNTAIILVLFILLVIVTRGKC